VFRSFHEQRKPGQVSVGEVHPAKRGSGDTTGLTKHGISMLEFQVAWAF